MTEPLSTSRELELEEVACTLCGSPCGTPRFRLRDVIYDLPGEFVMQRCDQCGLFYLSPRPTAQSIGRYYPDDYSSYHRPIEDERLGVMRWMRRRKLARRRSLVEQYSGRHMGDLLDVGSSTGLFLREMALAGWQVKGVEPISSAAGFARQRFGLEIFTGMLADAPYPAQSFDVITFWDVLEHTFSPVGEVAQAARLLRPGGVLALSVPNWESWERKLFDRHWQGLDPPRHLYVFTQDTLQRLLQEAGFTILARRCFMPSYFSFVISLDRWLRARVPRLAAPVRRLAKVPGMRLPFEPFFSLANYVGRGSVVALFARYDRLS